MKRVWRRAQAARQYREAITRFHGPLARPRSAQRQKIAFPGNFSAVGAPERETCPHWASTKPSEKEDWVSSALGVDRIHKPEVHKPARWGGGKARPRRRRGYGSRGVDRRRRRIPGREAISRGQGAKRGEKESKRHHSSTQQHNLLYHRGTQRNCEVGRLHRQTQSAQRAGLLLLVLDEPGEQTARTFPRDALLAEAVGFEPTTEPGQRMSARRESPGRIRAKVPRKDRLSAVQRHFVPLVIFEFTHSCDDAGGKATRVASDPRNTGCPSPAPWDPWSTVLFIEKSPQEYEFEASCYSRSLSSSARKRSGREQMERELRQIQQRKEEDVTGHCTCLCATSFPVWETDHTDPIPLYGKLTILIGLVMFSQLTYPVGNSCGEFVGT
jgi:hypothetical protein